MNVPSKYQIGENILVDLKEDGQFRAVIKGVAYNKGRIFYCVKAGGICLYTITEEAIRPYSQTFKVYLMPDVF